MEAAALFWFRSHCQVSANLYFSGSVFKAGLQSALKGQGHFNPNTAAQAILKTVGQCPRVTVPQLQPRVTRDFQCLG